jgi:hypothetical protein
LPDGTVAALVMFAASATAPEIKSTTKLTIIVDPRGLVEITASEVLALFPIYAGRFIGAPAESPDPKRLLAPCLAD